MAEAHGKPQEFDKGRETWINYVERLEFYFIANDVEEAAKKKAILL